MFSRLDNYDVYMKLVEVYKKSQEREVKLDILWLISEFEIDHDSDIWEAIEENDEELNKRG